MLEQWIELKKVVPKRNQLFLDYTAPYKCFAYLINTSTFTRRNRHSSTSKVDKLMDNNLWIYFHTLNSGEYKYGLHAPLRSIIINLISHIWIMVWELFGTRTIRPWTIRHQGGLFGPWTTQHPDYFTPGPFGIGTWWFTLSLLEK